MIAPPPWLSDVAYVGMVPPAPEMLAVYPLPEESARVPSNFHSSRSVPSGQPPKVFGMVFQRGIAASPVQMRSNATWKASPPLPPEICHPVVLILATLV